MVMEGPVVGSARLTPEEERTVIRDITVAAESQCKEGDNFYLITHRWWQHWLDYVNQDFSSIQNNGSPPNTSHCSDSAHSFDSKRPSVIDNTNLIYEVTSEISSFGIELHDTLVEGQDYILLPQDVWKKLHGWYGGGPVLPRKAISTGISHSELAIEVYELRLQLLVEPKGDHAVIRISKKETIGELHRKACEIFDLILDQVCIWDYYGHQKHALMDNMEKTLDDSNIQMDQEILVEVLSDGTKLNGFVGSVRENGSIGRDSTAVLLEHSTSNLPAAGASSTSKAICGSGSSEPAHSQFLTTPSNEFDTFQGSNCIGTRSSSSGLTGLLNLGNTCFMNSAIQCLVHTPEFARYFREDYRQEINWQNPLGMVGELALAFGELLRKLWAPGRTPVSPRPFKAKLARFAPQFSGYNQHDSQELLAFLLDGLHEDLNRVKHKPYIKTNDADGRPDEEVADEYWQNHISRNDSIIVDVCQGQYKSTLVCPVCEKVSVTFDPFMYLSLPLQFATSRPMTVTVFTSDGSASPSYCTVSVPKHGRCKDLIRALSNASAVKAGEKLLVAEIRGHLIHRFLDDPLILLSTIKDDDHLVAYKVPDVSGNSILLQLIHRLEERDFSSSKGAVVLKPYGTPLITQISCDDHITGGDIQKVVRLMLSAWLKSEESHTISGNCIPSAAGASQDISSSKDMLLSESSACQDQDGPKLTMDFILPLHIVDGNKASFDLSTEEAQFTKLSFSSTSLVVHMNWSTNDFEKYDSHSLESLPEVLKYAPAQKKSRNEPLSLYACMEAFLREEPLVPEDMWYCPQCKKQRQASKKLDLWRLPEVLVIHLKRFSYSRSNKHKLETFVNFPIHDFDLANYVASKKISDQLRYELYALSNHYGSMASGHYTAHIKLLDENRWYNFDDNHISPINEEDVKSAAAYVLFYRRVKSHGSPVNYGSQSYVDQNSNTSRR